VSGRGRKKKKKRKGGKFGRKEGRGQPFTTDLQHEEPKGGGRRRKRLEKEKGREGGLHAALCAPMFPAPRKKKKKKEEERRKRPGERGTWGREGATKFGGKAWVSSKTE